MYVVTGGAGFIGSAFVWRLNHAGIDDILIVDNLASTEKWKNLVPLKYAHYMHRDEFFAEVSTGKLSVANKIDAVIHMGACSATTERDADFLMRNNLHYTQKLCKFALEHGARFITASSAATYGGGEHGFSDDINEIDVLSPLNMYGYSKHLFDLWAKREKLFDELVSLKFFNVYGPNEYHKADMRSMICKAVEQIRSEGKLRLFKSDRPDYIDGGQVRDFIYVKDCVEIMWYLLNNKDTNGLFNIGTGNARSWKDLALAVFDNMQIEPNIEYIDMPEALKGKYQYFTQAKMSWLNKENYEHEFYSLEKGIGDYLQNYLLKDYTYLTV